MIIRGTTKRSKWWIPYDAIAASVSKEVRSTSYDVQMIIRVRIIQYTLDLLYVNNLL